MLGESCCGVFGGGVFGGGVFGDGVFGGGVFGCGWIYLLVCSEISGFV